MTIFSTHNQTLRKMSTGTCMSLFAPSSGNLNGEHKMSIVHVFMVYMDIFAKSLQGLCVILYSIMINLFARYIYIIYIMLKLVTKD